MKPRRPRPAAAYSPAPQPSTLHPPLDSGLIVAIEADLGTGVVALDPAGRQIHVNDAFCRMVGWCRAELLGAQAPFPYWPWDETPRVQVAFQRALKGDYPQQGLELTLQRSNGERFPALVFMAPLRQGSEPLGWVLNVVDLSAQQARADARRARELCHLQAQDCAQVGVWDMDIATGETYWSPHTARMYGLEPDVPMTYEGWRARVHPDDLAEVEAQWVRLSQTGHRFEVTFRIRLDSGEERWLLSRGSAVLDSAGRPVRLIGINLDITGHMWGDGVPLSPRIRARPPDAPAT